MTVLALTSAAADERPVQFNRDIRPILTDRCFACHGPDAETVEGGLRLDLRDEAIDALAITPGQADESEAMRRILSDDEDEVMPPGHLHKPLDQRQIDLIRRWIDEGAEYQPHWAYTPMKRPVVPTEGDSAWIMNDIDAFVDRRFREEEIQPSPPADPVTLIRRLSFDLTGLPPTKDEVDAFVRDPSDAAYRELVRTRLASDHYGERMASYWLDLVRYADTVGYHGDQDVSQSPYRDYVINAFNDNMPYDRFIREQLAGDLLPDPTTDQLIASGYNRLNQTTNEGGAQPKEYLAIYFADRVRNVSQVFMGATVGCAQCHDHKYDPYTAKDFYALGAFFADLEEQGKYAGDGRGPIISVPTENQKQQLAAIQTKIDDAIEALDTFKATASDAQLEWEKTTIAAHREIAQSAEPTQFVWVKDESIEAKQHSGDWSLIPEAEVPQTGKLDPTVKSARRQTSDGLTQHFFLGATQTITVEPETRLFADVYLDAKNPPKAVMLQFNGGKDGGDSWNHRAVWGGDEIDYGRQNENVASYQRQGQLPVLGRWARLEVDASSVGFQPGDIVHGMAFTQFGGTTYWNRSGWTHLGGVPQRIIDILLVQSDDRTSYQADDVRAYYLSQSDELAEPIAKLESLKNEKQSVLDRITTTVVSRAVTPREIRLLHRGNWMDESGEIMQPAIPEFLGSLDTNGARATRSDLADWLCRDDNVMTSRTIVNRLWYLVFGRGICSSVDDFGGQGTYPSHPELLDYLAVEFVESGWDMKHLIELMVTSATYRQSSRPTAELRAADPYNHWLARQGRFPLNAEMVRDNALMLSGLLNDRVGGPSAKPYQPGGYYDQLNFPRRQYVADHGAEQYRRGVYTHWQRTFLHPMLKAFDAPSREECTAMRARSNTPLQSLTLLNDPTFVETARVLAQRILREGGDTTSDRIDWAYRTVVSRQPDSFIHDELVAVHADNLTFYTDHPDQATQLLDEGEWAAADDLDANELAAWTSVARVLLNLHETIMRY